MTLKVGDLVTVQTAPTDPIPICLQPHARVVAVVRSDDEPLYVVDHPGQSPDRFGPYANSRVAKGWRDESGKWR